MLNQQNLLSTVMEIMNGNQAMMEPFIDQIAGKVDPNSFFEPLQSLSNDTQGMGMEERVKMLENLQGPQAQLMGAFANQAPEPQLGDALLPEMGGDMGFKGMAPPGEFQAPIADPNFFGKGQQIGFEGTGPLPPQSQIGLGGNGPAPPITAASVFGGQQGGSGDTIGQLLSLFQKQESPDLLKPPAPVKAGGGNPGVFQDLIASLFGAAR